MKLQEFYYGTSWHWPLPYLPRVMLSYNMTRTLKKPWEMNKPWMLDSGAYSIILLKGSYQWTTAEYAKSIQIWNPNVAWTMDYPCEPKIREKGKYTTEQAQDMTNENTIELEKQGVKVMNVLQGWTIEDYMLNLEKIKNRGLLTERLGIGSVCRRGKAKMIAQIIRAVHRQVPSWVKLHGFGIKSSVLSEDSIYKLYSADSMAWDMEHRYYSWSSNPTKGKTWQEKVPSLVSYVSKIENIISQDQNQVPLTKYMEHALLEVEIADKERSVK